MNINLIKLLGFLCGFFISLIVVNYIVILNNKEKINKETFTTTIEPPIFARIPNDNDKYMCINTFTDNIKNAEKRWYACDLKTTTGITINDNKYFTYKNDKTIELIANNINTNGSKGANLNKIELSGPNSYYFGNNPITNELTEFSVYFSGKINNFSENNNIIFELTGNTETINYPSEIKYSQSIVSLNFFKNQNNNFDIIITVGNIIYKGLINNIDKAVIINNDVINFYLIYNYTAKELKFILNNQNYNYKIETNAFTVKLGSTPVIINKGGTINFDLYTFVYYKKAILPAIIDQLSKHSYYYLSGLDYTISNTPKCNIEPQKPVISDLDTKLKEMESNIIKKIDNKSNEIKKESKVDMKPLVLPDNNEKTGIFDWFF